MAKSAISRKLLSFHSFNNDCKTHRAILQGQLRALWQVFSGAFKMLLGKS